MDKIKHHLLLADDDIDDCLLFQEALEDLPLEAALDTVNDGVQLMTFLSANSDNLPDFLFLDLNMPRKSGFECLSEIKLIDNFKQLPVIIFSTSLNHDIVNLLYDSGAHYYICKPSNFSALKKVILKTITLIVDNDSSQPTKDKFIIQP
jgi:CheY-like chemotaxis protein